MHAIMIILFDSSNKNYYKYLTRVIHRFEHCLYNPTDWGLVPDFQKILLGICSGQTVEFSTRLHAWSEELVSY